jgi:O-antigen/teichoic acid export membrane protein
MSIAKNYIYNVLYQIVTLIIPLITVPYISRTLGSSGVGTNAYTYSIIQYFILFGTIGIGLYGNRAVAYVRDDKQKLSQTFWEIFVLKLITTLIAYLALLFFLNISGRYYVIFMIQSLYIVAAAVDISWLYMGLEDFKKTVVRNLFVRIIGVVCIFIFVQDSSDLWKYVFILGLSQLIGQLTMWVYIPKTVDRIGILKLNVKRHLFSSIALFIPQIAIQVYGILNKTMLGYLSNVNEVGLFDNSDKIVKMILAVVTSLGVVMLPRVSNTFARGESEKVKNYVYESFDFASYLSIPMMFGIAGIAGTFTPWFFGPEFEKTGPLIMIISPIIVFIAWSNVIGQQYLMPVGKVRAFTISVSVGAIVNFIINLLLIRYLQSIGTAIATVIAELCVTAVQFIFVIHIFELRKLFKYLWKYMISGTIMFAIILTMGGMFKAGFISTCLQILVGIIIYVSSLFVLRSKINRKIFARVTIVVRKVTNR